MQLTSKQIIKAIGCDKLELVRGKGYWYFVYDDVANGVYDTHSVMSMYLGDDINFWITEGRKFTTRLTKGD